MNIAELFVRVTGSTDDLTSKMRGAGRSMDDFGNSVNRASQAQEGHKLSLGRVERALATYVGHAVGANAVTESLSVAFGGFAVGGGVVAGLLIGVGAVVAIYEHFTSAAHEAQKAQDDLIKSFEAAQKIKNTMGGVAGQTVDALNARIAAAQAKVTSLSATTPNTGTDQTVAGSFIGQAMLKHMADEQRKALDDANKDLKAATAERDAIVLQGSQTTDKTLTGDLANLIAHNSATAAQVRNATALIAGYQATLARLGPSDLAAASAIQSQIDQLQSAFKTAAGPDNPFNKFNALRDAADKVYKDMNDEKKNWWKSFIDSGNEALSITQQIANAAQAARPSAMEALQGLAPKIPTFSMPSGNLLDVGLTKEQIISREKLIGNADKNAQIIKSTIESMANVIVSALNIGGGGRGSSIGGALGGAVGMGLGGLAGAGIGGVLGSIVPGLGTVIGSLAGSFIGGLFDDNTKATNANTAATMANTAALIQFAPSGFKVEQYRYGAADPKQIMQNFASYQTRGGAVRLGT